METEDKTLEFRRIVSKKPLSFWYLSVKLELEKICKVDVLDFKMFILNSLKKIFGEIGASVDIDVLKYDENEKEAILRVPHSHMVKLWVTLTMTGSYNNTNCRFHVQQVSEYLMAIGASSRTLIPTI